MGKTDLTIFNITRTERGFERCEFRDEAGRHCSLQQSSSTTEENIDRPGASFVWLGPEWDRMHLNREQATLVMFHLSSWLEHGSFMQPFEEGER